MFNYCLLIIVFINIFAGCKSRSSTSKTITSVDNDQCSENDDLYDYMDTIPNSFDNVLAEQLNDYLSNPSKNIQSLFHYPDVCAAFIKLNSTLPSSAAVERLFSVAGQILSDRRSKLSDNHIDMMIFLRDHLRYSVNAFDSIIL